MTDDERDDDQDEVDGAPLTQAEVTTWPTNPFSAPNLLGHGGYRIH